MSQVEEQVKNRLRENAGDLVNVMHIYNNVFMYGSKTTGLEAQAFYDLLDALENYLQKSNKEKEISHG